MYNDAKIIDVDYTEEDVKVITNELDKNKVYYTIGQAAKMLDMSETKLRYWTNFFAVDDQGNDFIKVQYSNKNRAYSIDNINKLKRMKELIQEDGMTLQQAKDFTSTHGFDANNKAIDSDNPLALQAFVRELTSEIDEKLNNFENNLLAKIVSVIEEKNSLTIKEEEIRNLKLKEELVVLTNETIINNLNPLIEKQINSISKNMEHGLNQQKEVIDKIFIEQQEEIKRQNERFERLKENMEDRKKEFEKKSKNKFLNWLLNKI